MLSDARSIRRDDSKAPPFVFMPLASPPNWTIERTIMDLKSSPILFIVSGRISLLKNRPGTPWKRSEEHTSELQSLMRISYAVFCLKKKKKNKKKQTNTKET